MANTFVKIASVSLGSAAANIDFTSIPATYTDLCLVISARATNTNVTYNQHLLSFNGSTSNFSGKRLWGNVGGAASFNTTRNAGLFDSDTSTANTFGSTQIYIPNYAGSTNKSFSVESTQENNNSTDFYLEMIAGLWSNSAAINQITLTPDISSNYKQYTTATLYGIKNS
jgi:hypothetical protein